MSILQACYGKPTRLAISLLLLLFTAEELLEDVNVNGKSMNGAPNKNALDPKRIQIIKTLCLDRVAPELLSKTWKQCVDAIHKKLYNLRNNLILNSFEFQANSPARTASTTYRAPFSNLQTPSSAIQTPSSAIQTPSNDNSSSISGFDDLLMAAEIEREKVLEHELPPSTQVRD